MRTWGVGLAVIALALGAWYVLGEHTGVESLHEDDVVTDPGHDAPELQPADFAVQQAHRLSEEEKAEARLLARRGSGEGGFLVARLDEGAFGLTGRVVGPDGAPVEESEAALVGDGNEHDSAFTDDDGRYTLEYDAQYPMRLVLTAPGHAPWIGPWRRYRAAEHVDVGTIRLARGLAIAGRVVDQHDREVNVHIELAPDDDPYPAWWTTACESSGHFETSTNSGNEGAFRFDNLPPGRYRLEVDNPDGDAIVLEGIEAGRTDLVVRVRWPEEDEEPGAREDGWIATLQLSPRERVFATADPDEPQRTQWGGIRIPWFGAIGERYHSTLVRDTITTVLSGPGPAHAIVDDMFSGTAPTYVRDVRPDQKARDVRLDPGVTLKGRLVGVPPARLDGVKVGAYAFLRTDGTGSADAPGTGRDLGRYWRRGTVDANGRFRIPGMLRGTAEIQIEDEAFTLTQRGFTVAVDGTPLRLEVLEFPEVEVTCTVPASHIGEELHWSLADTSPQGGWVHENDTQDVTGRKTTWTIRLSEFPAAHILHVRTMGEVPLGPVRVRIPPGATRVDVALPEPRYVHGRIVDLEGKPLPRAYVFLRPDATREAFTPMHDGPPPHPAARDAAATVSRIDGTFELPLPPDGDWRIYATYDGHALDGEPILARPGKATVRMRPGYRITGRIEVPASLDTGLAFVVTAWPEDGGTPVQRVIRDGTFFELIALAPGTYTLTAHPDHDGPGGHILGQARVTGVKAGARGVRLALAAGKPARLALVNEKGTPLTGVHVWLRGPQRNQRIWPLGVDEPFGALSLWPGDYRFEFEIDGKGRHVVPAKLGETVRYVVR